MNTPTGLREKELRAAANCICCRKPIGHTGIPLFWRVTLERHGVNMQAVKRQDGLTAMLGGHAGLAQIMGPDEAMTQVLHGPVTVTVCEGCALESHPIAMMAEKDAGEGK